MQPRSVDFQQAHCGDAETDHDYPEGHEQPGAYPDTLKGTSGRTWVDEVCLYLGAGDITKRDAILWGYTPDECEPYLKYRTRDVFFREAILTLLGVGMESGGSCTKKEIEHCKAQFGEYFDWACEHCEKKQGSEARDQEPVTDP